MSPQEIAIRQMMESGIPSDPVESPPVAHSAPQSDSSPSDAPSTPSAPSAPLDGAEGSGDPREGPELALDPEWSPPIPPSSPISIALFLSVLRAHSLLPNRPYVIFVPSHLFSQISSMLAGLPPGSIPFQGVVLPAEFDESGGMKVRIGALRDVRAWAEAILSQLPPEEQEG